MKHYNIPIFLPESACPFRCVYCNQYNIAGQHNIINTEEATNIIESHLKHFSEKNAEVEVAFFGGNFTGLPIETQNAYLEVVQPFISQGRVQSIRCSTRPDYIDAQRLKELKAYGMKHIELGAQSTDNEVLKACGRGHDFEAIRKAAELIRNEGFVLGLQMMIGLPADSTEKDLKTARDIVQLGAQETRIYPCIVVKDTALEKIYQKGKFEPLSLEAAAEQSAVLYEYFTQNQVKVLRMGLHTSADLNGDAFVAGPYHANFAEMAFGKLWANRFQSIATPQKEIAIAIHPSQRNHAIGWKSGNKTELLHRFRKVQFVNDENLSTEQWEIRPYNNEKVLRMIIADSRMPHAALQRLEQMGKVLKLEPFGTAYESIAAHPDIYFFQHGSKLVCAANTPSEWIVCLKKAGINVTIGQTCIGSHHPETIGYNAVGINNTLIHNLKHTDTEIKKRFQRHIQVAQGYTRCNLIALNENNFISSDLGICKTLKEQKFNVLYIDPKQIILQGQGNGFFAGCCGLFDNKLFVCGNTKMLREKVDLDTFLKKNNITLIELYDGPLVDVGSILML